MENDDVKSSIPSRLHHIRSFGVLKLEDYKDFLTLKEYHSCEMNKISKPTWYPLTINVYIAFFYRVSWLDILYFHFL